MNFILKDSGIKNLKIATENGRFILIDENGEQVAVLKRDDDAAPFQVADDEDKEIFLEDNDTLSQKLAVLGRQYVEEIYTGVESDDDASLEEDPFDPQKISIDKKSPSMDAILRRLEQGNFRLNPDFQRNEVWQDDRKSRLIESLLLKIPIPMFYVSSDESGVWTVVDGLQRLSTIRDFVLGKEYLQDPIKNKDKRGNGMRLTGLEFWTDLNGKTMNELPINLYNRLCETEFSFTIINPGTPEEVKRNVFKRINTGGMPLSGQEIRHALYSGMITDLLKELVELPIFKQATGYSIKTERMEDRELVLRFISFLIRGYWGYDRSVSTDKWLSDTMIIANALPTLKTKDYQKLIAKQEFDEKTIVKLNKDEIKSRFIVAMTRAYQLFGSYAFRKSVPEQRRTPINKSLFETWGVLLSEMEECAFEKLVLKKHELYEEYQSVFHDVQFNVAISRDSTRVSSVKYRYELINNLINKYSHD